MSATCSIRVLGSAALALSVAGMIGCQGEQPPLVDVHGRVTYRGKPVPNLGLIFIPVDGRPSTAATDAQGNFPYVQYTAERRGLLVGEYSIVLKYRPPEPEPGQTIPLTPPPPPEDLQPLLAKYGDFQKPQITERITPETRELTLNLAD